MSRHCAYMGKPRGITVYDPEDPPDEIKLRLENERKAEAAVLASGGRRGRFKPQRNFPTVSRRYNEKNAPDDDLLSRFEANTFFELHSSPRFAALPKFDMTKYIAYRDAAIKVFRQVMLNLGPEGFQLSALYRLSVGERTILMALQRYVRNVHRCNVCKVDFRDPVWVLMHFASIEHGQKCLDNSQEPELLDMLLIKARDKGLFSFSRNPVIPASSSSSDSDSDDPVDPAAKDKLLQMMLQLSDMANAVIQEPVKRRRKKRVR